MKTELMLQYILADAFLVPRENHTNLTYFISKLRTHTVSSKSVGSTRSSIFFEHAAEFAINNQLPGKPACPYKDHFLRGSINKEFKTPSPGHC
uniref:Uncharacterized protein At1g04910-like n=1 Tax=Rhizophora mucronata TaxID=61149 RepID=A0A2P2LNA0_RHIMU